jgi:hypothetical protein
VKRRLIIPLALAAALVAAPIDPPEALAGTYVVNGDPTTDVSGWGFTSDAGFFGCSILSYPGPCAAGDVPRPTPLRVFAYGDVPAGGEGFWRWMAPPTTSIDSGSVTLTHETVNANTTVYMKARLRAETFENSAMVHQVDTNGTSTWTIPSGNEVVAVGVHAGVAHSYTDKWSNQIKIVSWTATMRDDTPPSATVSGPLADGTWHNQAQPVALTVAAADQGAGVSSMLLVDGSGATLDTASAPATSASQPGSVSVSRDLQTAPAALGDGSHTLSVHVLDAAGEQVVVPVVVNVDSHAPSAFATLPGASTTDLRPQVSFKVDPGPSGLASFEAWLDGSPMDVSGDAAFIQPTADLAYGLHTITWRATDVAGNARDSQWTFTVVDAAPPVISQQTPADGWAGELRRPEIGFTVTDAGTGVDPSTLRVAVDGLDVTAAGSYQDGRFTLDPAAPLSFATHRVRVAVSDRSGNAMPAAQWSFVVVDRTPPVLADVRPDPGSSSSDRTPSISVAVSDLDGSGVDPASLVMTLDGVDVSAAAHLVDARFSYVPASPLGYGLHSVSVTMSDVAGNASQPLVWSFSVRDEAPPVVSGRQPSPGVTVAGATTIGFDMADAGVGVDDSTLQVLVDGSDVASWGTLAGGHFRYSPGNLGPGVHTISVTVADRAGNVAGPVVWQFLVADPATLGLAFRTGPAAIVYGGRATLVFAATSNGTPLAGARVLVSTRPAGQATFGPARTITASATGLVSWPIAPARSTVYRAALADDEGVAAARTVVVRQRVTLAAGASSVRRASTLRLSGRVAPAHAGGRVSVQLLTRRGWVTVARPLLGARSGFSTVVIPPVAGRYLFRTVASPTPFNAAGTSRTVGVLVR